MKKYFLTSPPFLILFLIWFVFSSPYFIKGKVPFPSTYQVNNFAPWSHYQNYWGPVKNGAMPDVITQIYPWKYFTIKTLKSGQIPFWNPNNFSGNPHLANFQTAVFSPFNILFFVPPFIDAWSIIVLLQPLIAGISMYIFLRSLLISKEGSALGAISFMFCGFIVVWMAYGTLSMTIAFLPLTLFAIEKIYKKLAMKWVFLLAISITLSLFSGHFQTNIYLFLFSVGFIIFKFFTVGKTKETIFIILGFCLGLLISLPQLLPSIQFYLNSVRSGFFIKSGGIPFYYLVTLFSPDFFGNPVTRNDWFGYYAEWSSFVGIIPLLLALFSLYKIKNKTILFFICSAIIAIILAVDSPVQQIIGLSHLPVLSTSTPSRIIVLFSFSLSVLGAFGLDVLIECIQKKNKKMPFPFVVVSFFLLTIWVPLLLFHILPVDKLAIAKRNLFLPSAFFILGGVLAFTGNYFKSKKLTLIISYLFIFLVAFDSLRFAQKWMPFDPRSQVFPNVSLIEGIKKNIGFGRIFGNLGTEVNTYYGFSSLEGYDPLYIGRYGEFIQSSETGSFQNAGRSVVKLSRRGKYTDRVLDLLGVNLIFHPIADTNQGWAYPVWVDFKRYSIAYQDNVFQIFKNNQALDRAHLFYNYLVIKDNKEIVKKFYTDNFDFRHVVILEEDPHVHFSGSTSGKAKIISYSPNRVAVEVTSTSPALLFLSDNYYPGWIAKINGKESKILRADYSFRVIVVPQGNSTVELSYFPRF